MGPCVRRNDDIGTARCGGTRRSPRPLWRQVVRVQLGRIALWALLRQREIHSTERIMVDSACKSGVP
jgi:hypothetical protein